jgi:hypothetical protein
MSTPYDLPTDTSKIKEFEWDDHYDFPRDLVGYGENSFNPQVSIPFRCLESFRFLDFAVLGFPSCVSSSSVLNLRTKNHTNLL